MRFLGIILFGVISIFLTSCVEESKHLGKKFMSIWDGTYVPDVTPGMKRKYGVSYAETCAKYEKKQPVTPFKVKGSTRNSGIWLRCGGWIDKCKYKVIWYYKVYDKERVIEPQLVDFCQMEKWEEKLKKQGYIEFEIDPDSIK